MNLSVGIVGLPNAGKSTLFNALLQKQQALMAAYPFATIEPNVGVVPVEDKRLDKLAKIVKTDTIVPATVKFVDIAGLVKGAHQGEGLGNQFLSHIRETDLIVHVVRDFTDEEVTQTGVDPTDDLKTVITELTLADLATLEKQKEPRGVTDKETRAAWAVITKIKPQLEKGVEVRKMDLTDEEMDLIKPLFLLTAKPALLVVNIDQDRVDKAKEIEAKYPDWETVAISAKLEAELIDLLPQERKQYLSEQGLTDTGLNRLVKKAYDKLGLISFLTAGKKEVRAWTIKKGSTAVEAAGVIHTDFANNFIKAKVVDYDDFVACGGWAKAKEKGKVKDEGRDYQMKGDEVVEFMVSA